MTSVGTRLTAEEFARLPEEPDGSRMELVKGEVVLAPPPGSKHGWIEKNIAQVLSRFVEGQELGSVLTNSGFLLSRQPDVVRGPDVAIVPGVAPSELTPGYHDGAPAVAIEVVSPSDTAARIQEKVDDYLTAGARRAWVVWSDSRSVTVHRPDRTAVTHGSDANLGPEDLGIDIEGFALPVSDLFAQS